MDKLTGYRRTVRHVLDGYADWLARPGSGVRYEVVFDPALDHFELVRFGWDGGRRVHGVMFHLDIIDGKIWVQYDGTDRPIAEELVRAVVPKGDIVLAEYPPEVRPHTGYGSG
ncbi:XisI protein [Gemmata sp. JC717]|uniref:XisI protein n=1 Tax=Gemmata algarum TaxID=2975278 RepID=UPI0021BB2152|nr:XisI protein [Gemmata algarum]MDY3555376.1 XisI protein [Gemmata algarum]